MLSAKRVQFKFPADLVNRSGWAVEVRTDSAVALNIGFVNSPSRNLISSYIVLFLKITLYAALEISQPI